MIATQNRAKMQSDIVRAFLAGRSKSLGTGRRMEIGGGVGDRGTRYKTDGTTLWVWGNVVAVRGSNGVTITDAGWLTMLTRNVLNEIMSQLGVVTRISSQRGKWKLWNYETQYNEDWTGSAVIKDGRVRPQRRTSYIVFPGYTRRSRPKRYVPPPPEPPKPRMLFNSGDRVYRIRLGRAVLKTYRNKSSAERAFKRMNEAIRKHGSVTGSVQLPVLEYGTERKPRMLFNPTFKSKVHRALGYWIRISMKVEYEGMRPGQIAEIAARKMGLTEPETTELRRAIRAYQKKELECDRGYRRSLKDGWLRAVKTKKGVWYFPSFNAARFAAVKFGWPTDRIIDYTSGYAVQFEKGGTYLGPESKMRPRMLFNSRPRPKVRFNMHTQAERAVASKLFHRVYAIAYRAIREKNWMLFAEKYGVMWGLWHAASIERPRLTRLVNAWSEAMNEIKNVAKTSGWRPF